MVECKLNHPLVLSCDHDSHIYDDKRFAVIIGPSDSSVDCCGWGVWSNGELWGNGYVSTWKWMTAS